MPENGPRMSGDRWKWGTNTSPFSAIGAPGEPARFVVEQVSDKDFAIPPGLGFQYNPPDEPPITVTSQTLPTTDYASIPRYMAWLVSRYGRHTPAALVHDQEIVDRMPLAARKAADRRFLVMMDALEVPPVQSRVMWAAVTLGTRWKGPTRSKVGLVVWGASAAAGIGLFVYGVKKRRAGKVVLALLGPPVAAVAWGDQYWAGVVAGYALPFVALPALTSWTWYSFYWSIERSVQAVRQQLEHNKAKELPGPVGYQGR